ncbi:MAG: NUDIX domain-containing protein [Bacteroidota bacterium]
MSSTNAGLLMYRYGENGLEVFLVNSGESEQWEIPRGLAEEAENMLAAAQKAFSDETGMEPRIDEYIALQSVECDKEKIKAFAFEEADDSFELPLQHILGKTESPLQLRRKHHKLMNKGAYICAKDAVKKVFPNQVEMIKELQEILSVRNLIRYL